MSQGKIVVSKVEDVRPSPFPWGQVRWLYHGHMASDAELTFGIITLNPGESYPEHAHDNCEEIAYVLKGRIRYVVNGEEHILAPGTLIRAPRDSHHHADNLSADDTAVMAVTYSTPIRKTAVFRAVKAGEPGQAGDEAEQDKEESV